MNKIHTLLVVGIVGIIAMIFMIASGPGPETATPVGNPAGVTTDSGPSANVSIRDGIQYVEVTARGGYSPSNTVATGGIPTKLIVKTNGSYDCSTSLVVKSAGYRGMLPATGETAIDLATPKAGERVNATCSMGMYRFTVNFK